MKKKKVLIKSYILILIYLIYVKVKDDKSESDSKAELSPEERKRERLFKMKEEMKRNQEKNTTKKPKDILYRCFPSIFYIKYNIN
jgi:hypothetical protein